MLCQRGPTLTTCFYEMREDPYSTKSGPSSDCQRNTILMACHLLADGGPTLNAGLVALYFFMGSGPVLLRSLYFCDFSEGEGSGPPTPSGSAHVSFIFQVLAMMAIEKCTKLNKKLDV